MVKQISKMLEYTNQNYWNWSGGCLHVFLWRKKRVLMLLLLLTPIFYASHSVHLSLVANIFKVKVEHKHHAIKMCKVAWT
jgi:hypothetical protein